MEKEKGKIQFEKNSEKIETKLKKKSLQYPWQMNKD